MQMNQSKIDVDKNTPKGCFLCRKKGKNNILPVCVPKMIQIYPYEK
ncbi:hypothetical protein SAMN05444487_107115 [Marininema mesophilum]|uniref:Uncharacterized protein n=1 Tax=Marininema mesophilum TaxID=1048340 RepID=A0A1H2X7Q1_9BACL|nr:hypothetical protein SAMN05444487_107115 [Marininema mesophilum]